MSIGRVWSRELKEFFVQKNVPPEKMRVVPNGVDPHRFSPVKKDEALVS